MPRTFLAPCTGKRINEGKCVRASWIRWLRRWRIIRDPTPTRRRREVSANWATVMFGVGPTGLSRANRPRREEHGYGTTPRYRAGLARRVAVLYGRGARRARARRGDDPAR